MLESAWASLQELTSPDSPETALPLVHELATRMLKECRILDESLVVAKGADLEPVPGNLGSRQGGWSALLDDLDTDVDRQDLVDQIEEYRALFEALVAERAAP